MPWDKKPRLSISFDVKGMTIRGFIWRGLLRGGRKEFNETIAWDNVKRVVAFKRDCFTFDSIRMIFELKTGECRELYEDMDGWQELIDALPIYLPGAMSMGEWFTSVAFPAFEPCPTQLYPRIPIPSPETGTATTQLESEA